MTAILIPAAAAPAYGWFAFLMLIPIVLLLFRLEQRPSARRILTLAVFALGAAAVVVTADELVVTTTCQACTLLDTSTWSGYLAWLANGCWMC
jgi:predicted naringenin-chalcone synthase